MGSGHQLLFILTCVLLFVYKVNAAEYFRYACKPNGDISAINPNSTKYKHAYAFNGLGNCKSELVDNGTVIKVTDCPKGPNATIVNIILNQKSRSNIFLIGGKDHKTVAASSFFEKNPNKMALKEKGRCDIQNHMVLGPNATIVNIILNQKSRSNIFLIGGKDHKTVAASCSLEKNNYLDRVQIRMSADRLFRDVVGFPPGFYERPTNVSIEMFDVTGEPGYDVFTISYPIGITITGPPESEIFPEKCTAYSSKQKGQGLQAVVLEDGCAMEHRLMFSFSTQEANWFDRDIDIDEDMGRFVLGEGFHDVMDYEEEELPPPPKLFTNAYAFRFFLSNYVTIHCDVRICAPGSESCKLPCDEFATTTTAPTTTATLTTTVEPEPEPTPEPEVDDDEQTVTHETPDTANIITTTAQDTETPVDSGYDTTAVTNDATTVPVVTATPEVETNTETTTIEALTESTILIDTTTYYYETGVFGRKKREDESSANIFPSSDREKRSDYGNRFILGIPQMRKPHALMDIIVLGPNSLLRQFDEMREDLKIINKVVERKTSMDTEKRVGKTNIGSAGVGVDDKMAIVSVENNHNEDIKEHTVGKISPALPSSDLIKAETKVQDIVEATSDLPEKEMDSETNIVTNMDPEQNGDLEEVSNANEQVLNLANENSGEDNVKHDTRGTENIIIDIEAMIKVKDREEATSP